MPVQRLHPPVVVNSTVGVERAQDRAADPVLTLKIMPPRARKDVLARPRLDRPVTRQVDVPVVIVEAPTGYGKTLLLAQWRRAAMAHGAAGAWLKLDEQDDDLRLLQGIVLAIRQGTGRPDFATTVEWTRREADWAQKTAAAILAEWSRLAHPVVLVFDDFDRLREARAIEIAHYLVANVPSNGRIFIGARAVDDRPWMLELQAYGQLVLIGRNELAFSLEESIAFLKQRLPSGLSSNIAAQLHERTGGWPIGLELFVATIGQTKENPSVLTLIHTGSRGFAGTLIDEGSRNVAAYVIKSAVASGPAEIGKFLTDISILDRLSVELCNEVTARSDAGDMIAELRKSTPLIVDGEDEWFRIHHIAHDYLRTQALELPTNRRRRLHARAALWFKSHGLWEEAAHHALEAGDNVLAFESIENCVDGLFAAGKFDLLENWLKQLPPDEVKQRNRLRVPLAFRQAIKGRPDYPTLLPEFAASDDPQQRFTAAVVRGVAAAHMDDPEAGVTALAEWRDQPCSDNPVLLRSYYNVRRWLDELDGQPRKERQWGEGASPVLGKAALSGAATLHIHGVSYVNQGQPQLAARLLVPALARFEEALGRRSIPATLVGVTLAAIAHEMDDFPQMRILMADRMDLVDPPVFPEILAMANIAVAALAMLENQPNRALDQLEFLWERARAHNFVRIQAIAANELVKFHAAAGRIEPCVRLAEEMEGLATDLENRKGLNAKPVMLYARLASARASLAEGDTKSAVIHCDRALELARLIRKRRAEFEARLVRAAALFSRSGEVCPDVKEVANLAQALGLARLMREAATVLPPALMRAISEDKSDGDLRGPSKMRSAVDVRPQKQIDSSAMMTGREHEVLKLLARGMSNKEIAIALDIGAGTIKWHLKNLFLKFEAADRKQVVARARLLGLIDAP